MQGFLLKIKRRIFPKSLYARALAIIVVPVILTQLIVGYIFMERPWDNMVNKLVTSLVGEVTVITDDIDKSGDINYFIKRAKDSLSLDVSVGKYNTIEDYKNKPISFAWTRIEEKLTGQLVGSLPYRFNVRTYPDDSKFEINVKLNDGRILTFLISEKRLSSPTTYIFILWIICTSLFLMLIAVLFMKNQIRPITRLAIAAEKMGKGQEVGAFKPEGASEVRQAAKAFIEMRSRITRQIEQRTAMLAGVSHDIRTPITRMKLQLAMMKTSADVELLKQDLAEMEVMLEGYLSFARGEGDENTEILNVKDIVKRIVVKSEREGFSVKLSDCDDVEINARPNSLERAVSNVIGNACKYAKHSWVSIVKNKYSVDIVVEDDGSGIPEEQREDVFKPFYRMEKSRNTKTGGVGLGLSVAQDIIHAHGGEIFLEDSSKGGLKATIKLPL